MTVILHWEELLPEPHTGYCSDLDPVRRMADYSAGVRRLLDHVTADLEELRDGLNDFTWADLRNIDFSRMPLHGLRWSTDTRWDLGILKTLVRPNSVHLGGGVWEIRDNTAQIPEEQCVPIVG
ncbi:hypothetical protein ABIA39_009104 [Nocardia sp. GAS34]|uniref:hypothetical protein n=1 Tax=unclassified Nocardia TaxID=2637762 RepID=UPI003D1919B0